MNQLFAKIFCFWSLLLACSMPSAAQQVSAQLDTNANILIADTFFIDLKAIIPPNSTVIWPEIGMNIGDLEVNLSATSKVDSLKSNTEWVLSQHVVLTSFDTGYFAIPPFIFLINGDSLATTPQIVKIGGVAIDTADLKVKPIKDVLKAPRTFMDVFWPWGAIGLAYIAMLIGVLLYFKYRKKEPLPKRPIYQIPAHVWALRELSKLKEDSLWQKGEIKAYYTRISDIFRQYVELRYQQPALESTTPEIISRMKLLGLNYDVLENIKTTLTLADFVKFAKAKPVEKDHIDSFESVLRFVETTKIETAKAQEEL
jgi:hypothetical protein